MNCNNFSASRDLLYLSALCAGAAAGCLLFLLPSGSEKSKNRRISAALCFFSCTAAAFTASLIVSSAAILTAGSLFVPAAAVFILAALGFRFPAAGAAMILAACLCIAFVGIGFLRYPRFDKNTDENREPKVLSVSVWLEGESGTARGILVRRNGPRGLSPASPLSRETWNLAGIPDSQNIYFQALALEASPCFPFFGGERRGYFTAAGWGETVIFSRKKIEAKLDDPVLPAFFGFARRVYRTELSPQIMLPGIHYAAVFDGASLSVLPPK